MVSGRGQAKGCVATFIERKTRWYTAILIPDRSAKSMEEAVKLLHASLPKEAMKTATTDRGKEFSCYTALEKELGIQVYFADPYSSWQRGSNENGNGLFREFFPKKTNFDEVTTNQVNQALQLINSRPRRCLGWKTAYEVFQEELLHLIRQTIIHKKTIGRMPNRLFVLAISGVPVGNQSLVPSLLRTIRR